MTSGNPVLDKNLDCIAKYNPDLKEKLLNLPYLTNQIDMIETDLKEPNLCFNGIPLHDPKGAEAEAKDLFKRAEDNIHCLHVIFGIGLGYVFKEFCDKAKGPILLYEPNLEILRVTLELVDFSNELSKSDSIKIVSNFYELTVAFKTLYKYKGEVNFLFLNSYGQLFAEEPEPLLKQVQILKGTCKEQYNNVTVKGMAFMQSVINNLTNTLEATPLKEFENIYEGKTAIVVSAGPTLDSNIATLKKYRDNFVIFCVGTAFKALIKNGITPDFLNILEMFDCSGQVKGNDLSRVNMIMEPFVHSSFQNLKVKNKFLFPSGATMGGQYWSILTGIDVNDYSSAGTVSYEALLSAKMLGFKKLILVGQDLAYVNNQCYSKDGSYSDMVYEMDPKTGKPKFKIQDMDKYLESCSSVDSEFSKADVKNFADDKLKIYNDTTCFIKGITGEMVPTLSAYAMFVNFFKEFAYLNPDLELINTSMIGAQIDGFKNIPLEQALKGSTEIQEVDLSKKYKYDKNKILQNLCNERKMLENVLLEFKKADEQFNKFVREYRRHGLINQRCCHLVKEVLTVYDEIMVNYFDKHHLYKVISYIESLELRHYAESNTKNDEAKIKNLYNFLKVYFAQVEVKIKKLLIDIENQEKLLKESINKNEKERVLEKA